MFLYDSLLESMRRALGQKKRPITNKKPDRKVRLEVECLEKREVPATGLVAAYNFDQGTGAILTDMSGNGNNGTIANATWSSTAHTGKSLYFNGTNAMVTVPDANSLDLSTGMTLEAWVDPTNISNGWRYVIYKGYDSYYLSATSTHSKLPAGGLIAGSSYAETFGKSALPTNKWAHSAVAHARTTQALYG